MLSACCYRNPAFCTHATQSIPPMEALLGMGVLSLTNNAGIAMVRVPRLRPCPFQEAVPLTGVVFAFSQCTSLPPGSRMGGSSIPGHNVALLWTVCHRVASMPSSTPVLKRRRVAYTLPVKHAHHENVCQRVAYYGMVAIHLRSVSPANDQR